MAVASGAEAQEGYPNRPVRIIVPTAPGGGNDVTARLIAQGLSERMGRQFVVENRTGAAGLIGGELVARSKPDGYTSSDGRSWTCSSSCNRQENALRLVT